MCNADTTLPERKIVCKDCDGEGYKNVDSGYYYDASYGNYLPSDEDVLCEDCKGNGYVWSEDYTEDQLWDESRKVTLPRKVQKQLDNDYPWR